MISHLVIRNAALNGRIGCRNTIMLTACGQTLQPDTPRKVTLMVHLANCEKCLEWRENIRKNCRTECSLNERTAAV
jgi:hypothetical protein